ncbi:MAG: oligoribonuclease [Methylophilaceae bacterium 17-44-8]|nr:MAG: oligoribonuclease [Methylophilales bacterium 28-44-11]OZA06021.1 MAG: oligoribonuclease [Methylophilaceae bacterium 17-44-8]
MEIMMVASNNNVNNENLIWLDMEMSGLLPDSDRILELAAVVTDANLNVLGESPVFVIHQSDAVLDGMDAWNKGAHSRSGLIDKVKASIIDEQMATEQMIAFLKEHVPAGKSPMCGNSICQDRRFMARYMPDLESYFHYRNLDVSVFKELARRWKPEIYSGFKKASKHEALADIYESIDELKYYREHFIVK